MQVRTVRPPVPRRRFRAAGPLDQVNEALLSDVLDAGVTGMVLEGSEYAEVVSQIANPIVVAVPA
jgi:hypothetical protein